MSAPRIRVVANDLAVVQPSFLWWCTATCGETNFWCGIDVADTIHEAATAGLRHLEDAHGVITERLWQEITNSWPSRRGDTTYSRVCGIGLDDCQAKHCDCADTDQNAYDTSRSDV